MSTLTGRALDWAVAAPWGKTRGYLQISTRSSKSFDHVFNHPAHGADVGGRLHSLHQGIRSVAEYTLEFRTLAADSGWDDTALRSAYQRGLSEEIKVLLVRDCPATLNDLSALALRLDERLQERQLERAQRSGSSSRPTLSRLGTSPYRHLGPTGSTSAPTSGADQCRVTEGDEPMQLGRSRLSPGSTSSASGIGFASIAGMGDTSSASAQLAQKTRLTRGGSSGEPS